MRRKSSGAALAKALGIRKGPALSAVLKAQIIAAILREMERRELPMPCSRAFLDFRGAPSPAFCREASNG